MLDLGILKALSSLDGCEGIIGISIQSSIFQRWRQQMNHMSVVKLAPHHSLTSISPTQPVNWSPKYLQSLYLSVNITSLSSREIIKYARTSDSREASWQRQQHRTSILPSVAADDGDVSMAAPKCEINNNEERAMRTLIR